jgi:hypothetical protein
MQTYFKNKNELSFFDRWALASVGFFLLFLSFQKVCLHFGMNINYVNFLYIASIGGLIQASNLLILIFCIQIQIFCLSISINTYITAQNFGNNHIFDPFFDVLAIWSIHFGLIIGLLLIFYCARYFFESELKHLGFSPFFISLFPRIIIVSLIYIETYALQSHLQIMLIYNFHLQRLHIEFYLVNENGNITPPLEIEHFQYLIDLGSSFEVGIGLAIVVVGLRFVNFKSQNKSIKKTD